MLLSAASSYNGCGLFRATQTSAQTTGTLRRLGKCGNPSKDEMPVPLSDSVRRPLKVWVKAASSPATVEGKQK